VAKHLRSRSSLALGICQQVPAFCPEKKANGRGAPHCPWLPAHPCALGQTSDPANCECVRNVPAIHELISSAVWSRQLAAARGRLALQARLQQFVRVAVVPGQHP